MVEVLACMRINDGFRLILSAIAIGIEEIGFAQQAEEAKQVCAKPQSLTRTCSL